MKHLATIVLSIYLLTACKDNEKTSTIDQLFTFAETYDVNYCSPDSILGTNCGGGTIYLRKKGYVLYSFDCLGADTTTFSIGKYKINKSGISCTFDKEYAFYNGFNDFEEPKQFNPNSGTIKPNINWTLELQNIICSTYKYGFKSSDQSKFVLNKADIEYSKIFKNELASITKLTEIWK
jgi:hypothetical protein